MDPLDDALLERYAEQVVQEIWIEMGRQRVTSLRELARMSGMTHTAVTVRMNGDSRTGKRVVMNVRDLAAIGHALGLQPYEWLARAQNAINAGDDVIELDRRAAVRRIADRRARALQQGFRGNPNNVVEVERWLSAGRSSLPAVASTETQIEGPGEQST